ncbi:MAG: response regulator transcription factor [Methanobacteriota archaeon]
MSEETRGKKTRILLADGHDVVRQGIRRILEREPDLELVGEADDGLQAVRLAGELMPDVVLTEARMTKLDAVEVTRRIKAEHPEIAVIVLTSYDDEEYIMGLLGAGAAGYLLKSTKGGELAQAIRFVRAGEFVSNLAVAQKLYKRAIRRPVAVNTAEHLTHRELEVLRLAGKGLGNRDIAHELGVAFRTVKGHLEAIFAKMGVSSRTEAVLEALKRGWISLEGE